MSSSLLIPPSIFKRCDPLEVLHLRGDNEGTVIWDSSESSKKTIINSSGVTQSTTQRKFLGKSMYFDGTKTISIADSTDFSFGTGEFCVECFFYVPEAITPSKTLFAKRLNSGSYGWLFNWNAGGLAVFAGSAAGTFDIFSNVSIGTPTLTTWHHLVLNRYGNTIGVWYDGSLATSKAVTGSTPFYSPACPLYLGGDSDTMFMKVYIDEFIVTKGQAKYTGAFTPSTRRR